jgi:hypothetical protein
MASASITTATETALCLPEIVEQILSKLHHKTLEDVCCLHACSRVSTLFHHFARRLSYRVIEIIDDPKLDRASGVRSYTCSDLYETLKAHPDIAPLIKCLSVALPQADAIFSALFNLNRPPRADWSRFSDVVNLLSNLEHLTIKNFRLPLHQPMLEPVLSIVQRNIPRIQCIVWFPNLYPLWNAERSLIDIANNVFRVTNLTLVAVLLEEHLERILQHTKGTLRHLSLIWNCALDGCCSSPLSVLSNL